MLMPAAGAPIFMLALLLNGAGASFVDVAGAGRHRCRSRRALSPAAYSPGAAPDDDGVNSDPQQQSTSVETLASLERCMRVANLETDIQVCEEAGDLRGAIAAYTALLAMQPPTAAELSAATSARRALQELLLESAQRELAACEADEACDVGERSFIEQAQRAGEAWRKFASSRALRDVKSVREIVVSLLEETEAQARADADAAAGEQAYERLVEGGTGWLQTMRIDEAQKRMSDARLLRRSMENDLNRLELQLLQGDPTLAFIREVLAGTRPGGGADAAPPAARRLDIAAAAAGGGGTEAAGGDAAAPGGEAQSGDATDSLWLREQFESGALPRDPELLRTLLAQARRDPAMVERLVTQAKDAKGKDIYTRRVNDPTERILGLDGLDTSQFNM